VSASLAASPEHASLCNALLPLLRSHHPFMPIIEYYAPSDNLKGKTKTTEKKDF
jgi:hypothetical protein